METKELNFKELQEQVKQDAEDNQSLIELATGEKYFTYTKDPHGFDCVIRIKSHSLSQKNRSEMEYSKVYNKLLQDEDYLTNNQIIEIAEKRGVLTEADQVDLVTIDKKMSELKAKIKSEKTDKKKEKLTEELNMLRDKKFRLAVKVGSLTSTSIENLAESAKVEYLILNCIFVVNGDKEEPLYKTKEELQEETNLDKLQRIVFDARSIWFGEGLSDFLQLDG